MRTTIELNDRVYAMMVQQSVQLYGSARNLSRVVNDCLERALVEKREGKKKSMFGVFKGSPVGTEGLREKTDRIDKW